MKGLPLFTLALASLSLLNGTALGGQETDEAALRSARAVSRVRGVTRAGRRTASRRLASVDNERYSVRADADTSGRTTVKEWSLNIGLLGGYANAVSNNANEQSSRDGSGLDRNIYIGGVVDLRVKKHIGFELEGHYNYGLSENVKTIDRVLGTRSTVTRSLQQYGGLANLKGRLPFSTRSVRWEPYLGAGFGTVGLMSSSTPVGSTVETQKNSQLWGFYATLGLEVEPFRRFVVMADYARSFGASGRITTTTSDALAAIPSDLESARFERWRGGAYYRFTDRFMAGGQYIGRRLTFAAPGEANNATQETLNQFLGLIMVGF